MMLPINCCLPSCFFQAELAVPVVLCNPQHIHMPTVFLRSHGNKAGTQVSFLLKACL